MKTQTQITVLEYQIDITADICRRRMSQPWGGQKIKQDLYCNEFDIMVECKGDEINKFKFYGSHNDCENGKVTLGESDLIHAFYCHLSDALSGELSPEEFCSEFGYEGAAAITTYNACSAVAKDIEVFSWYEDRYDLINELQEVYQL